MAFLSHSLQRICSLIHFSQASIGDKTQNFSDRVFLEAEWGLDSGFFQAYSPGGDILGRLSTVWSKVCNISMPGWKTPFTRTDENQSLSTAFRALYLWTSCLHGSILREKQKASQISKIWKSHKITESHTVSLQKDKVTAVWESCQKSVDKSSLNLARDTSCAWRT